ncbi:MAG: TolC family protein [Planctomycetota bacterium]
MRRNPLALITLAPMACTVDQQQEVALYRDLLDTAPPPSAPRPGEPLTLVALLWLTNQNNEQLAIQGESYVQALIARKRAAAAFVPTVSLVPSYVYREQSASGIPFLDDPTQLDVPVAASIDAFRGFQDRAALRASEATSRQQRELLLDLRESLLLDVARIFYQVLRSQQSVVVLENSLARQDERVRDMRARYDAGMARPLDVAQTEAQASGTRLKLIDAQNDVARARSTLGFLTGIDVTALPLLDELDVPAAIAPLDELEARAVATRPDVLAADAAKAATRHEIDRAVGQYYPTLQVDFAYFLSRDSLPTDRDWNGLLSLSLPIFSGGRIHADVRRAWSQFRQAELSAALTRRRVHEELAIARHDLGASTARLAEVQVELSAAEAAFAQAEDTYAVGMSTNLERLTAQDELLTAQLRLASEQFDRKAFYLTLVRASGELGTLLAGRR